jgi:hypothetical protein
MKRILIPAAVLLLVAVGCGDSDNGKANDKKATAASALDAAQSAYADKVNELCEALIDDVVPITGDSAPLPTRKRYISNSKKLAPVYKSFDAAVDSIEAVTPADEAAEKIFWAYLMAAHVFDEELTMKAAVLNDAEWDAQVAEAYDAFEVLPERQAMLSLGVQCPAR